MNMRCPTKQITFLKLYSLQPSVRREDVGRPVHNNLRRQTIRDCRDWSVVEYTTVTAAEDDIKIQDDGEEHEHRLESWNKVEYKTM